MKKARILVALSIIVALVVPFSVFAATSDSTVAKSVRGLFGIDYSKLNDQQKADVNTYSQKIAQLQKEFVDRMVANGSMTREEGDAEKNRIDEALKSSQDIGTAYGLGPGKGFMNGKEKRGFAGKGLVDASKLTDQQKADLKATEKKMADLQKEYIDKVVSFGLLTRERGDKIKSNIDAMKNQDKAGDASFGLMMGKAGLPGLGMFGCFGTDQSKLTEQQKTELANYPKEMAKLQKTMVNKLVEFGAITKDEGDAAIKRIDAMSELKPGSGLSDGKGMMKRGRFNRSALPEKAGTDLESGSGTAL